MKTYVEPEMDIIEFETEDVITGSGGCDIFAGVGDGSCDELPIM